MKKILCIVSLCLMSTLTFAAKPDWAGKGKPDREDVEGMVEEMKDSESRRDILDRGKPDKGKKDKDHDEDDDHDYDEDNEYECELSKEECAAIRAERKAERMAEKEARKAEREAEKAARKAEREAAGMERGNKGKGDKANDRRRDGQRGDNAAAAQDKRRDGQRGDNAARADEHRKDAEHRKEMDQQKAMDKQAEMKAEMEQKELDKGSEKGQQMRETNSKKWWQFWK